MIVLRSVRQSYIDLRGLNLGVDFIRQNKLEPGQRYSIVVEGLPDTEVAGKLEAGGFIGGLSAMYKAFDLKDGDQVGVAIDSGVIRMTPPPERRRKSQLPISANVPAVPSQLVFARQNLRQIHIEPFAFGSLSEWVPYTEADVYLVFGTLSEYTDYRYVCGASKALLDRLGYSAGTKPDAVLIDRSTGEYLMAEFKMTSRDFASNHKPEDVDVLVCWDHDETDATKLPTRVVALKQLVDTAIRNGELQL